MTARLPGLPPMPAFVYTVPFQVQRRRLGPEVDERGRKLEHWDVVARGNCNYEQVSGMEQVGPNPNIVIGDYFVFMDPPEQGVVEDDRLLIPRLGPKPLAVKLVDDVMGHHLEILARRVSA